MTPTTEQLKHFLDGRLSAAEAARVAAWIEADPAAADVLAQLDAPGALAVALKDGTPSPTGVLDEETVGPMPHSATSPEPIASEFRIIRELGRGGMGIVYEAEDARLGRRVAIKKMLPGIAAHPDAKARFLREARAMAAVESDYIVPVLHVGETADGTPYLVMPLLAGETLAARLVRGPLTVGELEAVARDTARGLAAAHAKGLIHRDIKPSNLWLEANPDGSFRRVRLLDFGLAKPTNLEECAVTASNAIVGTPQYMSPEQARAAPLGPPTDLFSLGAVLYRATTGKLPFPGDTASAILTALAVDEPTPCRQLDPSVPDNVANLIHDLLRKQPAERPTTDDVIRRLATATTAPAVPPQPPRRRTRVWIAAAAAAFFAVVSLGIVIIVRDKTGKEVGRVTVPDGGSAEKVENGKVTPFIQPQLPAIPPGGPSPLDKLDPKAIPQAELPANVPEGLVVILGSRHCRGWGQYRYQSAAIRPDGQQVVYQDENGEGSSFDVTTGKRTGLGVRVHDWPILYSADGKRLLAVTQDEQYGINVIDLTASPPKPTFFLPVDPKLSIGYECRWQRSNDGRTVVISGGSAALILDWPEADKLSVRCTVTPKADSMCRARVSANGKTLAIQERDNPTVEIWDVSTKEPKKRLALPGEDGKVLFGGHAPPPFDFLPDGRLVALHADKKLRVWDVSGEKPTATVVEAWKGVDTGYAGVVVAPSGDRVTLWNASFLLTMTVPKTGAAIGPVQSTEIWNAVPVSGMNMHSFEFSADGKRAVTTHLGRCVVVWDATADGLVVKTGPKQTSFDGFGISPDGKTIMGGSQGQLLHYELGGDTPKLVKSPKGQHSGFELIWPDLRLMWKARTNLLVQPLLDRPRPIELDVPEYTQASVIDDFSSTILFGRNLQQRGDIWWFRYRTWDLTTDKPKKIGELAETSERPWLLFAGGKHVVSAAGYDEAKKVYKYTLWTNDGGTYKTTGTFTTPGSEPLAMAASTDGKRFATASGQVYEVTDGNVKLLKQLSLGGNSAHTYYPAFSPDGKKLAFPGRVSVYDIESGELEYRWPAELRANKVLFAPDGRHLITGNLNGTAFIIRVPQAAK